MCPGRESQAVCTLPCSLDQVLSLREAWQIQYDSYLYNPHPHPHLIVLLKSRGYITRTFSNWRMHSSDSVQGGSKLSSFFSGSSLHPAYAYCPTPHAGKSQGPQLDLPGVCGCSPALAIHYLHGLCSVLPGMPVCGWPRAKLFQHKAQTPISHPVLALANSLWGFTAAAEDNVVDGGVPRVTVGVWWGVGL